MARRPTNPPRPRQATLGPGRGGVPARPRRAPPPLPSAWPAVAARRAPPARAPPARPRLAGLARPRRPTLPGHGRRSRSPARGPVSPVGARRALPDRPWRGGLRPQRCVRSPGAARTRTVPPASPPHPRLAAMAAWSRPHWRVPPLRSAAVIDALGSVSYLWLNHDDPYRAPRRPAMDRMPIALTGTRSPRITDAKRN
eukprot:XP_008666029.1 uncharacterized protein LOC103644632 [Zea mays]